MPYIFSCAQQLYKRVCPLLGPLVGPSVGRSVGRSVRRSVGPSVRNAFAKIVENGVMQAEDASYVVNTALFRCVLVSL